MKKIDYIREAHHALKFLNFNEKTGQQSLYKKKILDAVKFEYELVNKFSKDILTKDFIKELIDANPKVYFLLSEEYKNDLEIVLAVVSKSGLLIEKIPSNFLNNRSVVLAAVSRNGDVLMKVPAEYQNDEEIVLRALKSRGKIYEKLPLTMKRNFDIINVALKSAINIIFEVPEDLQVSKEILLPNKSIFLSNPKRFASYLSLIEKYERENKLLEEIDNLSPLRNKRKI